MLDLDPFHFFRLTVGWVATIYATVVLVQTLWGWVVYLSGGDRYMTVVRRYLVLHALRLRFKSFWGDVLVCVLLCWVFVLIWMAHNAIEG
ncbi:MAG: hypothetical protein ACAI43_25925 [Phycisphaerae bacterium]|nr:hypothetical protein [Tepidisphaeraceae bacterium]